MRNPEYECAQQAVTKSLLQVYKHDGALSKDLDCMCAYFEIPLLSDHFQAYYYLLQC